jgi:hypothetical protein
MLDVGCAMISCHIAGNSINQSTKNALRGRKLEQQSNREHTTFSSHKPIIDQSQ